MSKADKVINHGAEAGGVRWTPPSVTVPSVQPFSLRKVTEREEARPVCQSAEVQSGWMCGGKRATKGKRRYSKDEKLHEHIHVQNAHVNTQRRVAG